MVPSPGHLRAAWTPALHEALTQAGYLHWQVAGNSMAPTLPPGCTIRVEAVAPPLHVGEIVLFARGDQWVVHRLVRRVGEGWITQGDARRTPDGWIPAQAIVGRVARAYLAGRVIWPSRMTQGVALWWLCRYYLWRGRRAVQRWVRAAR